MDERPKIPLDYSSVAEEQKEEQERERQRRESLENYNESTYGERRPYFNAFLRIAILMIVVAIASIAARGWLQSYSVRLANYLLTLAVVCTLWVVSRLRRL